VLFYGVALLSRFIENRTLATGDKCKLFIKEVDSIRLALLTDPALGKYNNINSSTMLQK
jgi:hypothetical protein